MKSKHITLFLLVLLFSSCGNNEPKSDSIDTIYIDSKEVKTTNLSTIGKNISIKAISLPDTIFFGDITSIKTSKDQLYLLDQSQTQTITVIDKNGLFLQQLKRPGDAPEEYDVIHDFSIDESNNQLVVYDRNSSKFVFYDLSDFSFIKSVKVSKSYMSFEVLDEKHWLAISDSRNSENKLVGTEIINGKTFSSIKKLNRLQPPMSVKASESVMIEKHKDFVNYSMPDTKTTLYKLTNGKGISEEVIIDFGSNGISSNYWNSPPSEFIKHLMKEKKATAAHSFLYQGNQLCFWYMMGGFLEQHLNIYDLSDKTVNTYDKIKSEIIEGHLPPPTGIFKNQYLHLIDPSTLKTDYFKNPSQKFSGLSLEDVGKSIENETPLILLYQIK